MKYWEIIADNLTASGWSWGCVSTVDSAGQTTFDDIDRAIAEVERAGGRLLRRGEFAPGLPYAYVADPDGYEIEIWFE